MHKTIALADRRPDDGTVDQVAINYALHGWATYAMDLSVRELRIACHTGADRDLSAKTLGALLFLHPRQVNRFRAEPCPTEDLRTAEYPLLIAA